VAFEQNQQINRLLNPIGMPQNQLPTGGMGSIAPMQMMPLGQDRNKGFFSKLGEFFGGTPQQQLYNFPYTQQQYGAFNNLLNQGQQNINNPYAGFEPLQQQIMNQFYNEILPGIAARFTASTGGALSSPSFAQQIGSGAQGLAERLAAHKVNYGQQNRQFGLQQTQLGLTPQFESSYIPRQPGFFENLAGSAAQGLGAIGGRYLGGGFS
jgi:hypothetical protein